MPGKEAIRHRGARDFQSLKTFITQSLEGGNAVQETSSDNTAAVEGLHDLTTDSFDDHIALGHHFVKFYAPWCGHCKRLEPTWKQLAAELKDRTDVSIGRVSHMVYFISTVTGITLVCFCFRWIALRIARFANHTKYGDILLFCGLKVVKELNNIRLVK